MEQSYDAVVIGSGFGGAVSACRLAQAKQRVLILERGRRYPRDSFPRNYRNLKDGWLWTDAEGLFDVRPFNEVTLVQGAGYGGGSLIYANVHLRAPAEVFAQGWPEGYTREALDPYYDLVAYMLDVQPITKRARLPAKTRLMKQVADQLGRSAQFCYPNLAINLAPATETRANKFGVSQSGCNDCGECDVGCNRHSKNTLDLNYLAVAEQNGALARTQCEVFKIAESAAGGYVIWFRDAVTNQVESVHATRTFLCGGAVNSTELLLRCRNEHRSLPNLSDRVGQRFSGNGDYLAFAFETSPAFVPSDGPTITTGIVIDQGSNGQRDWFIFEEGGYPKEIRGLLKVLSPVLKGLRSPDLLRREHVEQRLRDQLDDAVLLGSLDRDAPDNTAIFLAMGRDRANGTLELLPGFGLHVQWDNRLNLPLYGAEEQMARDVAEVLGGELGSNPFWSTLHIPVSVHNLGGCAMGTDPVHGVTDAFGQVFNYPGLYVLDGAILPEATGVNPSHTIAAVAERNVEHVIRTIKGEADWRAPERLLAPRIDDPLSAVTIPQGGTPAFRSPSIGLSFTETMKGFLASPLVSDMSSHPPLAAYEAAAERGQAEGRDTRFELTITFPNLDGFLADPAHGGSAVGKLVVAGLTPPSGAEITAGAFNLFTTSDEFYERQMLYGLPFLAADRTPHFLEGYKEVKDHGRFDVWDATTTLYARIRKGQTKDGPVIAIGVLHILVPDFLRQLTTFRVHGTKAPLRKTEALARFGRLFLGSLWDVFVRMRLQ